MEDWSERRYYAPLEMEKGGHESRNDSLFEGEKGKENDSPIKSQYVKELRLHHDFSQVRFMLDFKHSER